MATQFELDCALMAGASYISTRPNDTNKFPVPGDWITSKENWRTEPSGFEATYFTKGSEIVISFAGTYPGVIPGTTNGSVLGIPVDLVADAALGFGNICDQLRQAADYYLSIKASAPAGTKITLTGHSLGGGIASLIAVMFGESAVTFDQAPFRNAALTFTTTDANGNTLTRSAAQDLRTYLANKYPGMLGKLDAYIAANDPWNTAPNVADTLTTRSQNVSTIRVDGEFLSGTAPFSLLNIIGNTPTTILHGPTDASGTDLHSQALLAAFLQSDRTASVNATTNLKESLGQVTFKLTDLLKMIFDKKLFAFDTDKDKENFIDRLARHEAGNAPLPDGTSVTADAMVSRFTRDLWKLAQDGGLTLNDGNPDNPARHDVSNTLIAFAMQMYYENTTNATNCDKELFTKITGGLQFDMADVSKDFKTAFEAHAAIDELRAALSKAKGLDQYFTKYLFQSGVFTAEESAQINAYLAYMRDWYIQAGTEGMNATDTLNRGAFMLGGSGNDSLTGGSANDLLVGNAGNDVLDGGAGDDILLGGAGNDNLKGSDGIDLLLGGIGNDTLDGGEKNDLLRGGEGNDTYSFTDAYGIDIVTDSDGRGTIQIGGQTLGSFTYLADNIYKDDTSGQIIVKANGGTNLVILKADDANRIIVKDWSTANSLGISLQGNAPATPAITLAGDFKKAANGNYYIFADGNRNYVSDGAEANALDLLSGSSENDVIDGGGGDDEISGRNGDDYIIGGTGGDVIQAGFGKDTIIGGDGDDVIYGSSDDRFDLPTTTDFQPPVNSYPHPQSSGFNWTSGYYTTTSNGVPINYLDYSAPRNRLEDDQGNVIDAGGGDDLIAAGTGADFVHGGDGNDCIYGMDKDDILFGSDGNDLIYGDGNMPSDHSVVWSLPENHGADVIDGGSGNDIIYGQGKNDIIFGGSGNDTIYGDDSEAVLPLAYHGNDILLGGEGDDLIIAGGGADYIEGGAGTDTLAGGAGKDVYFFNAGDGVDVIDDDKTSDNIIRFGAGIDGSKIKLGLGSLKLDLGNGDVIHIDNFDRNDVFNSAAISSFEFSDGSTLNTKELLARGFDLDGTDATDVIYGTNTSDRITGRQGADYLEGGAGDDTYFFKPGDSHLSDDGATECINDVEAVEKPVFQRILDKEMARIFAPFLFPGFLI